MRAKTEQLLCAAVAAGEEARFGPRTLIDAALIRTIVIGARLQSGAPCPQTPVGIAIRGAIIVGRLVLDDALGAGGGALNALIFRDCEFRGGVSARHAHFNRLCFEDCHFTQDDPHQPTIDLTGIALDANLGLERIKPKAEDGLLWIMATGARIDGDINLNAAQLRAPPADQALKVCDTPRHALGLNNIELAGDIVALGGFRAQGLVAMRNALVKGDVWLSGAELINPGDDCLWLQTARIEGNLMLNGRADNRDGTGPLRRFRAQGCVNLLGAHVGGDVCLHGAEIDSPDKEGFAVSICNSTIGRDLIFWSKDHTNVIGHVRVLNTQIGGSAFVGNLTLAEPPGAHADAEPPGAHADLSFSGSSVAGGLEAGYIVSGRAKFNFAVKKCGTLMLHHIEPRRVGQPDGSDIKVSMNEFALGERPRTVLEAAGLVCDNLSIIECYINGPLQAKGMQCRGDCEIDAAVNGSVDLSAADIGGALDISKLRLVMEQADPALSSERELSLRDGKIGRALRLQAPRRSQSAAEQPELIMARRAALPFVEGAELIECLWQVSTATGAHKAELRQSGCLVKADDIAVLDGKPATVRGFFERHNGQITDIEAARAYLRVFCAYLAAEDGRFRVVESRADLPAGLELNSARQREDLAKLADARAESQKQGEWTEENQQDFDLAETALRSSDLATILSGIKVEATTEGENFLFSCGQFYAGRIFQTEMLVSPKPIVAVEMRSDAPSSAPLSGAPRLSRDVFLLAPSDTPDNGVKAADWLLPETLIGMQTCDESWIRQNGYRLKAQLFQMRVQVAGTFDLTDLTCETLEDAGGTGWDPLAILKLNLFTYRQTKWEKSQAETSAELTRRRRLVVPKPARALIRRLGLRDTADQLDQTAREVAEPWMNRKAWLFQQYRNPFPSEDEYYTQPFEQIIRVARSEGNETIAINFEIERERIERIFSWKRTWKWYSLFGLISAIAWYIYSADLVPGIRLFGSAVIGLLVWFAPWLALQLQHYGFGFMRKPVRAFVSLALFAIIGWLGVHTANRNDRLVLAVAPVAGMVASERPGTFVIGSQRTRDIAALASDIPCGDTIDEPLYALDVLIPLVDLHQEDQCEVGKARREKAADKKLPVMPAAKAAPLDEFWAQLHAATIESTSFWSTMKAVYAILGWVVISLAILTFTQTSRRRGGSDG